MDLSADQLPLHASYELPIHIWARIGSSCLDVASFWALSSSDLSMRALRNDPDLIMWRHGRAKKDVTARISDMQDKLEEVRGDERRMVDEERDAKLNLKARYDALKGAEEVLRSGWEGTEAEIRDLERTRNSLLKINGSTVRGGYHASIPALLSKKLQLAKDIEEQLVAMRLRCEELRASDSEWWTACDALYAALSEFHDQSSILLATRLVGKSMESRIAQEERWLATFQGMEERIDLYKGKEMRSVAEERVQERDQRWRARRAARGRKGKGIMAWIRCLVKISPTRHKPFKAEASFDK